MYKEEYNKTVDSPVDDYRILTYYIMNNTVKMYENEIVLKNAIKDSESNQYIVYHDDLINIECDKPTTNIIVSKKKTFEAAREYKGKKIAVLNFANNCSPGGAGSPWTIGAQEQLLCRCSTLYPCLLKCDSSYYEKHKKMMYNGQMNKYGNDDIIYTPNVVVFKSDEETSIILDYNDWYNVNVITCAAPKLGHSYDLEKYKTGMSSRIRKILQVAKKEKIEVLILGAFGCGAFNNPPEVVAEIFKKLLNQYHFDLVEFAVYCRDNLPNNNYHIFKDVIDN